MRSRIIGSMLRRLLGADTLRTVLRCSVCVGGSMAMNGRCCGAAGSVTSPVWANSFRPRVMPFADEKVSQSPSTARTSSYLVTDQ